MHYVAEVTVLPAHTIDNPLIVPVKMSTGTLTDVSIVFPPGCVRLVNIQIFHGPVQILPTDPETYYAEDSMTIPIKENIRFGTGDNVFFIVGWHVGCSYRHRINVHFDVRDVTEFTTADAIIYLTETMAELSERIRGWF
jgi:hypothetical protein